MIPSFFKEGRLGVKPVVRPRRRADRPSGELSGEELKGELAELLRQRDALNLRIGQMHEKLLELGGATTLQGNVRFFPNEQYSRVEILRDRLSFLEEQRGLPRNKRMYADMPKSSRFVKSDEELDKEIAVLRERVAGIEAGIVKMTGDQADGGNAGETKNADVIPLRRQAD